MPLNVTVFLSFSCKNTKIGDNNQIEKEDIGEQDINGGEQD